MEPWAIEILKQSPVAAVLGAAVYFLWKKLERAEAQIAALQDEIQALLTQRAQENAERFAQLVEALKSQQAKSERPGAYSITTRTKPTRD